MSKTNLDKGVFANILSRCPVLVTSRHGGRARSENSASAGRAGPLNLPKDYRRKLSVMARPW